MPSTIRYSPLVLPANLAGKTLTQVLREAQAEILRVVRRSIMQSTYSAAAKRALSSYLKVELGPASMTVTSSHPAFLPMLAGQKRGTMTWLKKARSPIPIVTEQGELIFRTATARSMAHGGWQHPGRASTGILEQARDAGREILRERLAAAIRTQIRASWGKR